MEQMLTQSAANSVSKSSRFSKGKDVWRENLRLTALAAERVRSSLGPNGAYKMVSYSRGPERVVKVTKDAVPVLEELAIQHPALAVLSEAAKMQRQEIGDGVTSFVILASALLKNADGLMTKKVHPNVILDGYLEATKRAIKIIEDNPTKLETNARETILEAVDCGRGTLTTALRKNLVEASEIVTKNGKVDKNRIRIIRKQGADTSETQLVKGIIVKKARLHRNMPDNLDKPRIAVTSGRIGGNRVEVKMRGEGPFNMRFEVQNPEQLNSCQEAERQQKRFALDKLDSLGVNVLFCQQPIDTFAKCTLLNMGVLAFGSVDRQDCTLIASATRANMVASLADLRESDVGTAERLEIEKLSPDEIVTLAVPEYATFLLRGSSVQAFDDLELLIQKSLILLKAAVEDPNAVPSCGATEMRIARELEGFALGFSGKQQLAVEGFAEALMEIPRCLAENNGVNPDDALAQLSKLQADGFSDYGICADGSCGTACPELSQVKSAVIKRAYEFVSLMLRIDEQITRKEIVKFHKKQ
jgi:chaperonin GroEL (HSP60 family)